MNAEPMVSKLLALMKDAREQLVYFQELGVENIGAQLQPDRLSKAALTDGLTLSPEKVSSAASIRADVSMASTAATATAQKAPPGKLEDSTLLGTLFGDLTPVPATIEKSSETFEQIWADVGDCTRCPLHQGRTNIVHTEGNRRARLMFVGEAPGADEDAQARPFVGRAGQLLTKIIEALGFKREEVLIGNVNRCRPPGNRPPTEDEASMCKPFLLREIAAVQPEVIVVLGNTAMRNLLDIKQGITKVRGQFQDYHGVKVMPTFHPAYLLRDPSKKQETWQDLKKVRDYLETSAQREK